MQAKQSGNRREKEWIEWSYLWDRMAHPKANKSRLLITEVTKGKSLVAEPT